MAFATDIAGDYAIFDGLESVTLRQVRAAGTNNVSVSSAALRLPASRREQFAAGVEVDGESLVFELPASVVGSAGVKTGDTVVDSSNVTWRVREARLETLVSRWHCLCTKQE